MRSVSCDPGQARFTVIPASIRSWAAVLAHAHSPVRATFDIDSVGMGCLIDDDVMKQMRPQPRSRMCGTASRASRTDVVQVGVDGASRWRRP